MIIHVNIHLNDEKNLTVIAPQLTRTLMLLLGTSIIICHKKNAWPWSMTAT